MTTPTEPVQSGPKRRTGLRALMLGAAFAATFVVGGVTFSALPAAAVEMAMDQGGDGAHGAMHAMMMAHLDKLLDQVGATDDQKTRIETILKTTMAAVQPMHHQMKDMHGDLMKILTAPTIDRAALEQARAAHIAELDQASKTMVGGLADAADVLTPDQRAKLASLMGERHHHRHHDEQSQ